MFTDQRPYRFHIELTDKCNAGCPMCSRTDEMNRCRVDKSVVKKVELSLDDIRQSFTPDFCQNVEEVDLCGTYGDPIAASQCLEVCEYFADQNVNIVLSTNGGLRTPDWWTRLGHAFCKTRSKVELHVDGLGDVNGLYRINTSFDKIMENIKAYLATGAAAEWNFILFKHNEHQVVGARELSRSMGFKRFVLIDTVRFDASGKFKYQMPDGTFRYLEPSGKTAADFVSAQPAPAAVAEKKSSQQTDRNILPASLSAAAATPGEQDRALNGINCKAEIRNRAYIDAFGDVSACCWISRSAQETELKAKSDLGAQAYNIRQHSMRDILGAEPFHSLYRLDWLAGANKICRRKCGDMKRNQRTAL